MKKLFLLSALILSLIFVSACGEDDPTQPQQTQGPSVLNPAGESIVSVYDTDVNLVGTYPFSNAMGNTIDVAQFQKTGYKFEGIYDMNQNIMLFNASGNQSPTVMLDTNFTAILKYSPITYQLVFDAEEGELENAAEYTKLISYEEAVGLFPKPVLEGKEFDGWFDEAGNRFSEGTTPVSPKFTVDGYTLAGETIQLHARYTTKYCDVRLMMQDGSSDIKLQVVYGDKLPDLTEYLKDDGSRAIIGFGVSPNSSVPFEDAVYTDLDLYALWTDYKYVNFVYSGTETKVVKVFREGNQVTLPDGVWPGYEFEGWYSSALLSGNKITTIPFSGMADTYYGKWSVGSYTIQFVAEGKLAGSVTYSIDQMDIVAPQVPEKKNYTGQWESYTLEFKDMVVNAVYTPEEKTVTLMNGADYNYHTITYGELYTLPVLSRKGYDFTGWYYKDVKLTDENGNALTPYLYDNAIDMTAGWEPKVYQLYFETNGGKTIDAVSVKHGEPYELTQVPERTGYHFAGWYDEAMVEEYINTVTVTEDTVLYAKWVKSTAIYDAEDLKKIADNPAGNYHLMADIDLKNGEWVPVENFSGIFDGNGHKIQKFSLRQSGTDLGFVITNSGIIKNVTFTNVDVSSVVDGEITCSIGVVCAYNTGRIYNVKVDRLSMLVNVANTNANNTISISCMAGQNAGMISNCVMEGLLVLKEDVRADGGSRDDKTYFYVGGMVGKNTGTVTQVKADLTVDANEYVHAYSHGYTESSHAIKRAYLHIGGISGAEYGSLSDSTATMTCILHSDAGVKYAGNWLPTRCPYRYTYIGGIVGCAYETSSITDCYSDGSMELTRIGHDPHAAEFTIGGIVGKVSSGTVDNCASSMAINMKEGYAGMVGGIVGLLEVNGKVTNVAFYGQIKSGAITGGYFGGLAGKVCGWLTKGYFHGQITSESAKIADIAGWIDTAGSVSKTIGNGNTGSVCAEAKGSSMYNYLIGKDYDADILLSRQMLFDDLGLYESDLWNIDEETGLYLIAFPENELSGE